LSELVLEVCPTCTDTSAQTVAPLADRGINDRLVELRPLTRWRDAFWVHRCSSDNFEHGCYRNL